jgi:YD repeat-containing protein
VRDLTKWEVRGPVASLRTETATWDLNQENWQLRGHFTVASFRRDGAISSTDSHNADGSIAYSRCLYDHSGLLMESRSWMNDEPVHRALYLYDMRRDGAGRLVKVEIHLGGQSIFGHCNQPLSPEVGKATSLIMEALGGIFSNTTYSYDSQGRLFERTDSMFNLGGGRTTYRYGDGDDPIEETTEHWRREANLEDDGTLHYTSDKVTAQQNRFEYRYDTHGNWVERTVLIRPEANAEFQPSNITHRAIAYHSL